jgi:trans-aconitate methyltransferase
LGVDLSKEAIARANLGSSDKIRFEHGDMLRFKTDQKFNVILFSESLYYLKPWQRQPMLRRSTSMLRSRGHIIVTISQPSRFAGVLQMIRRDFSIIEDRTFSDSLRHLLVLR